MSTSPSSKKSYIDSVIYGVIVLSVLAVGGGFLLIFFSDQLPLENVFGSGKLEAVNFETLAIEPGENHFLSCPEDYCSSATPDEMTQVYPVTVITLRNRLLEFIDGQLRVDLKTMDIPNLQFEFLAYQGTNPFPDVVTVQLYDLGGNRSSLAIYSRTIKGDDDVGANRARVMRWLRALEVR